MRHVALATPKVVDEHVLLPGRMVCDDGRQADGEEVEERLRPRGREPIGRWVDRLWVVGDAICCRMVDRYLPSPPAGERSRW